jgi:hypothetical protein
VVHQCKSSAKQYEACEFSKKSAKPGEAGEAYEFSEA